MSTGGACPLAAVKQHFRKTQPPINIHHEYGDAGAIGLHYNLQLYVVWDTMAPLFGVTG